MKTSVLFLAMALPVAADGLLGDETASPYAPEKPTWQVNDIVKIEVREISKARADAGTQIDKDTRLDAALRDYVRTVTGGKGLPHLEASSGPDLNVDGEVRYNRDGKGNTTGSNNVQFTVAARVIEVLDNGNLVLAARKEVQINDEIVTMTVTGEVDPEDVTRDRTVSTDKVADVKIRRTGDGEVDDAHKRGFFSWLFETFWPF